MLFNVYQHHHAARKRRRSWLTWPQALAPMPAAQRFNSRKALNDPIKGIRRSPPWRDFTKEQKDQIASMQKAGDMWPGLRALSSRN